MADLDALWVVSLAVYSDVSLAELKDMMDKTGNLVHRLMDKLLFPNLDKSLFLNSGNLSFHYLDNLTLYLDRYSVGMKMDKKTVDNQTANLADSLLQVGCQALFQKETHHSVLGL